MEMKMKQKFLAKNSQDLLVANEETALCLEQLNKDEMPNLKPHTVDSFTERFLKWKINRI